MRATTGQIGQSERPNRQGHSVFEDAEFGSQSIESVSIRPQAGCDVRLAMATQELDGRITHRGHDAWQLANADTRTVLPERRIADVEGLIFNAPAASPRSHQVVGRSLLTRQIRDRVMRLGCRPATPVQRVSCTARSAQHPTSRATPAGVGRAVYRSSESALRYGRGGSSPQPGRVTTPNGDPHPAFACGRGENARPPLKASSR